MTPRRVLAWTVAALASLVLLPACTTTVTPTPVSKRPNIVFVLTDDLSTDLVQYMPHVLALQKAGTSFSKYYVTDSLCCPSRASIFTGEFPHNTGVFTNGGDDGGYGAFQSNGDENKSFAIGLQKAGYRTAMMGKYLNQYDPAKDPVAKGWDEWAVAGRAYDEFNYTLNENGTPHNYGSQSSDYLTDVLSSKAGDFIDSAADDGAPFMMEVATFAPHKPATPAPRYANAAQGVKVPMTPNFNTVPTNPPAWLRNRTSLTSYTGRLNHLFQQRVRADLAVDDLIANLEKHLVAKGIADNTYFIFNSDNGYHIGQYRLQAGKQTAFDTDIHVPLVVSGPGVTANRVDTHLASNIDLGATFLNIAGAPAASTADGTSLLGLFHGEQPDNWQQAVLVEHRKSSFSRGDPDTQSELSGNPPTYQAVRTASSLLVRYDTGEYEYYDTDKDPYELHNDPSSAPADLKSALEALTKCSGAPACQKAAQLKS